MGRSFRRAAALVVVMVGLAAMGTACVDPPPPGGTATAVLYGPWTVPAANPAAGGHHGGMGMLENQFAVGVQKPCTNCFLTGMQANLIDAATGESLNIDDGLWLHHMVMFNGAKTDLTCNANTSGIIGRLGLGQRFFSSGNERTPTRPDGLYGYPVGANDRWSLIYDLMNTTAQPRSVKIVVNFTWVPDTMPGYRPVTPVWLDINQCNNSQKPAQTGQYSYNYVWTAPQNAKLIGIGGHLHDGGDKLTVTRGNEWICVISPTYGLDPAFIEGRNSLSMPGMPHISAMSRCQGTREKPVATVKAGDQFTLTAYYDSNKHMQMGTEPVMGIAIGYFDMAPDA
jgi:hypothetical protein